MGRLSLSDMGHTVSVRPPVNRPTKGLVHSCRDQEIAMVVFEADEDAVLDLLPPEVEPAESPPQLNAWVSRIPFVAGGSDIGVGSYEEFQIAIYVTYQQQRHAYIAYYYVSPSPDGARTEILRYSRHVRGYPAKSAWITFEKDLGQHVGCVERPKGKRLATLTVQPECACQSESLPMGQYPGMLTKLIPAVEHGRPPAVCELIQFRYNWMPKSGRSFQGSGTLSFDSPTDIDPVYRLAPTRILSAWHVVVDSDMKQGRVLKNLLESEVTVL